MQDDVDGTYNCHSDVVTNFPFRVLKGNFR